MQRMRTVQPKSGHPEDTLPEWNVTKPSLHNRSGDMERAEQSRAIQRSFSRLWFSVCQDCEEAIVQ